MHRERLEHLIQTLEDVAKRDIAQGHKHFNMGLWTDIDEEDKCGTTACAWGWEAMTDYAKQGGVRIIGDIPVYQCQDGFDAAALWFDLSPRVSTALFADTSYTRLMVFVRGIKPDNVIARVRYLLGVGEDPFLHELKRDGVMALPGALDA